MRISQAVALLARLGLVRPGLAALMRRAGDWKKRHVEPGEPMPAERLRAMAEITPALIGRAKADWRLAMPPRWRDLLDAEEIHVP